MDVKIYADPNPALGAVLVGGEVRRAVEERANMAMLLYQAQVTKRTGALAASAHVTTEITHVVKGQDRWVGTLLVGDRGVDYALAHEFGTGTHPRSVKNLDRVADVTPAAHDLNIVLEQLSAF